MSAELIVGRESERKEPDRVLQSPRPELLVVFGRRRVGKTFLVRQHYHGKIVFEISGLHYLQHVEAGQSAAQVIDRLCFLKDGLLVDEFSNLYQALFDSPEKHEAIVRSLAQARKGCTRNELAERTGIATGGTLTKILTELEESGFIVEIPNLVLREKE